MITSLPLKSKKDMQNIKNLRFMAWYYKQSFICIVLIYKTYIELIKPQYFSEKNLKLFFRCLKSREIFLQQPILLELEAPLKICGEFQFQFQFYFILVCFIHFILGLKHPNIYNQYLCRNKAIQNRRRKK